MYWGIFMTNEEQQQIEKFLANHQLQEFLTFLGKKTQHQNLESIAYFIQKYYEMMEDEDSLYDYDDTLFFNSLDEYMVKKELYANITWYMTMDQAKFLFTLYYENKLDKAMGHLLSALPSGIEELAYFLPDDLIEYPKRMGEMIQEHVKKKTEQIFSFSLPEDSIASNYYFGEHPNNGSWGLFYHLLEQASHEEIENNKKFYQSLPFSYYNVIEILKREATVGVKDSLFLENFFHVLSLNSKSDVQNFTYLLTEDLTPLKHGYNDLNNVFWRLYEANKKTELLMSNVDFFSLLYKAGVDCHASFGIVNTHTNTFLVNQLYKEFFDKLFDDVHYTFDSNLIHRFLDAATTYEIQEENGTNRVYDLNPYAYDIFSLLLNKKNAQFYQNTRGLNKLTLYLTLIERTNKNRAMLKKDKNFGYQTNKPLDFSILDKIFQEAPELFTEPDSQGKYAWQYFSYHSGLIGFDSNYYNENGWGYVRQQFAEYLKFNGLENVYLESVQLVNDADKEESFFDKVKKGTKHSFDWIKNRKIKKTEQLLEQVSAENQINEKENKFKLLDEQVHLLTKNEIQEKLSSILEEIKLSQNILDKYIQNTEEIYFVSQCIEVYLPNILENYLQSQKYEQTEDKAMFNHITLEQLEILSSKLQKIVGKQSEYEKSTQLNKMQAMTKFLESKA